jgi:hydroxymethylpyrimidine/phosphomethylpyrimidine kinase
MRTALTIAGSDSSGGAGIQADLKTFAAFGVYGTSALTAVTAQNTLGITASLPLPADLVTAQIEAVAGDITIHATKIGMLATAAVVEAVAAAVEELDLPMVVLDPVLAATSGTPLLDDDGIEAMRTELLPRAFIVTPNAHEAAVLSRRTVASIGDAREAARRIHHLGPRLVIVTGGDSIDTDGEPDIVDLLFDGREFTELRTPRLVGPNTHGTGCTFASAIAAGLALGQAPVEAVSGAQRYVAGAIRHGPAIGHGRGPLNHFWGGILKA